MVYAVRDFAKYRQEFYAYITVGQAAFIAGESSGVNALTGGTIDAPTGTFPPPASFTPGLAAPSINLQVPPGTAGRLALNPSPGASAYGYLNTLLQKASFTLISRTSLPSSISSNC